MTTLTGGSQGYVDGPAVSAQFFEPTGVAADIGGNVFVSEWGNNRIRRIDWLTRMVSTVAGNGNTTELDGTGTTAQFNSPYGLTTANGSIWAVDYNGGTVRSIGTV